MNHSILLEQSLNFSILFGGLFALIKAIEQLMATPKRQINFVLFSLFVCTFVWQSVAGIENLFLENNFIRIVNTLVLADLIAYALTCPLLYLFFVSISDSDFRLKRKNLVHFVIPAGFISVLIVHYVMQFHGLSSISFRSTRIAEMIDMAEEGLLLTYSLFILKDVGYTFFGHGINNNKYVIIAIGINMLIVAAIIIGFFFGSGFILVTVLLLFLHLLNCRYPDFLHILEIEKKRSKYANSQISHLDLTDLNRRLVLAMQEQKAFCQEELSLKSLAEMVGVTTHQLSELINVKYAKSFTQYINNHRIEEAKHLLTNHPELSVLEIGYQSGFNSSSTFYRTFNRTVGIAPGNYRKQT